MARLTALISRIRVLGRVRNTLSRVRHFRGHGIHSPYIYRIVREVFMRRTLLPNSETELYTRLEGVIKRRYATELQNIYTLYNYTSLSIDDDNEGEGLMSIYTTNYPLDKIESHRADGATIVVLHPDRGSNRTLWCREVVERHPSTTLHRADYLVIFNNHLPKQHFQL